MTKGLRIHNRIVINKWFGGLCNNIAQLCHAIYLAKKTRSYLEILPHPGFLHTRDFDFTNGEQIQNTISGNFFALDKNIFGVKTIEWNLRRKILKTYVRPMLPEEWFPHAGNDSLTIHIRSGDIFRCKTRIEAWKQAGNPVRGLIRILTDRHRVNTLFVQPPLAFYKRVIESKMWSRIVIVAQDMENPVIPTLLNSYSNIEFQLGSLESDIIALLSAQNVIIGYGSFGLTWALVSDYIQSLYSPLLPDKVFGQLYPGDISDFEVYTFEFENYISVGQWKASERQKRLMLSLSSYNIRAINETRTKN